MSVSTLPFLWYELVQNVGLFIQHRENSLHGSMKFKTKLPCQIPPQKRLFFPVLCSSVLLKQCFLSFLASFYSVT